MGKLEKQLDTFLRKQPKLGKSVYIAKSASVLGDVIAEDAGVIICEMQHGVVLDVGVMTDDDAIDVAA